MSEKIAKQFAKLRDEGARLLKGGFFHIFTGTFLNKAVTMISSIIVARIVNKESYAYLSYADTIYGYLALFGGLGLSTAILKTCAGNTKKQNDLAYLKYAFKVGSTYEVLITIAVVSICLFSVLPFEEAKKYILVTALYPLMNYILDLMLCYLRAKQQNKRYAWISFFHSGLICLLSIAFVIAIDAIGLIYARYISLLIIGVIVWLLVRNLLCKSKEERISTVSLSKQEKKTMLSMGVALMIANAFSGMMPYNESMLIGHIMEDEATLADFRVASLLPQMILLVTQAVNVYYFPIVSEMDNHKVNVRRKVIHIGLLNLSIVSVAFCIGIAVTPKLITMLYGEKYTGAISISYMLWIVRSMNAAIRMVPMNMLIAIGKYRFNLLMSILASIIQLISDYYFISKYGVIGIVYGTVCVYFITGILYWIYFFKATEKVEEIGGC